VALTGVDSVLGTVAVTHNGAAVENVFLSVVDLENQSQKDLADLELDLSHSDGFTFLGGTGSVTGSARRFEFTARVQADIARLLQLAPQDLAADPGFAYLNTHREYRVPVLNRGARATFVHTITGPQGRTPFVTLSCDYPGVRLRMEGARRMIFGVPQTHAMIWGALTSILLTAIVASSTNSVGIASVAGFVFGGFANTIGVPVVKLIRLVTRVLS
jgi:hypothetical protein